MNGLLQQGYGWVNKSQNKIVSTLYSRLNNNKCLLLLEFIILYLGFFRMKTKYRRTVISYETWLKSILQIEGLKCMLHMIQRMDEQFKKPIKVLSHSMIDRENWPSQIFTWPHMKTSAMSLKNILKTLSVHTHTHTFIHLIKLQIAKWQEIKF